MFEGANARFGAAVAVRGGSSVTVIDSEFKVCVCVCVGERDCVCMYGVCMSVCLCV